MPGSNFFSKVSDTLEIALTDATGLAVLARCLGAAPTPANVFQHGCLILRVDSGDGVGAMYQNTGTSAVPVWTLVPLSGGGSGLSTTLTAAHLYVGNGSNVATDVAVTGDISLSNAGVTAIVNDAVTTAKILDANVTKAKLAAGISGTHMVVAAGTYTSVGGGTTETISAAAVTTSDIVQVSVRVPGATPRSVVAAVAALGSITVTMSGDASIDHILQYTAFRATT